MLKEFTCVLILVLSCVAGEAQRVNPFDIETRTSDSVGIQKSLLNNLESQNTSTPEINTQEIKDKKITPELNKQEDITRSQEDSFLSRNTNKQLNENPFNVSHVQIKKLNSSNEVAGKSLIKPVEIIQKENEAIEIETSGTEKLTSTSDIPILDEEAVKQILPENIDKISTNKFIFWLIFLQLLLVSSLLGLNREILRKIFRSINNDNFAKLISRDFNNGYNALFVILYFLFFLSFSIYIYLTLRFYYDFNGFTKYVMVLLGVITIYFIRHTYQNFAASVFPFKKASKYYDFMIILFNSFLGLLLMPVNLIIAYAPQSISVAAVYIGMFIIGILYIMRSLRGSLNAYTYIRNYLFHFFLYLCTCEIAPVFILVKLFSKSFIN